MRILKICTLLKLGFFKFCNLGELNTFKNSLTLKKHLLKN